MTFSNLLRSSSTRAPSLVNAMRTGYPVASVLTSLAFLRFLSSVAAREAARFQEMSDRAPSWMAALIPLPHQTSEGRVALARALEGQCGNLDPGERVELAEAADRLFGTTTVGRGEEPHAA